MKILLVADHESSYIWDHFDRERFSDIDLILSAGDLRSSYLSFLVTMIPAPLYYVPGNHDGEYEKRPPEGCHNLDDRVVKLPNGMVIAGLGGSLRYNNTQNQYTEEEMALRVRKLERKLWRYKKLDIVLTHAPAKDLGDGKDPCHTGFSAFRTLIEKHQPSYFLFGHQHLNYGRGNRILTHGGTTLINCHDYYILEI